MKIDDKIHRTLIFLMIFKLNMILAFVPILPNNAFAQTLYNQTVHEVVKQTSGLQENPEIDVGESPIVIDINERTNTVYVVNRGSDSVTIMDGETNTKIGEDIPVGKDPIGIVIHQFTNTAYVAGSTSSTGSTSINVTIMDGETNTKIGEDINMRDIRAEYAPRAIGIHQGTNAIYVANAHYRGNSVSVIDGVHHTLAKDIPVGLQPTSIGVNEETRTIYVANSGSGSVSVIYGNPYNVLIKDIPLGKSLPGTIDINERTNTVYVAYRNGSDISVIDGETNTKIEDIPVGHPSASIGINEVTNTVYVANYDSNSGSGSISVIDGKNNTKIGEDIPVGLPASIGINEVTNTVYVANYDSNSISVIDGKNNTKIKDIPVGDGPRAIGVNQLTNTVYVANGNSNTISVIDGTANRVVAGITFQVNPFNSGYILCDGLTTPSPTQQYIYVYSSAECIAKPNEDFEFVSWEENLAGNSTQLMTISRTASTWDSILNSLGIKPDKPEATLNVTKFGTFTANFKELPPPFPPEYWLPLYGIVASTIVGWSIPTIIGWAKSKRDVGKLNYYHKQIASLYEDSGKLDENDIEPLNRLRRIILDAYSEGKINEKHYESLRNEISILYEKIFRKRINDALNTNANNDPANKKTTREQLLAQIKTEVKYAYSEGKINEKHYNLLTKDILDLESKEG